MRVVIAHGHIFKNAGSTFDWSLQRNFRDAFLDHREDKKMREQRAKHLQEVLEANPNLLAISSHHMCHPLPELEDVTFEPVHFLRHPIERIASVYAFERRQQAETRGAKAAKEKNFQQYVEWRMQPNVPRTIRDYQTSNISGKHDYKPREAVGYDTMENAVHKLAGVNCVGIVDRYDESMLVFEQALRQHYPELDLAYVKQNVSKRRLGKEQTFEKKLTRTFRQLGKLRAQVLLNNSYDMALYRLANQKLDAALAAMGDVEERLAEFRNRCAALAESS